MIVSAPCAGSKPVHPQMMMYKCVGKPWVMRGGALVLGAASFMVVWSEATIGLGRKPDVSPFSLVPPPPFQSAPFGLWCSLCNAAVDLCGVYTHLRVCFTNQDAWHSHCKRPTQNSACVA